MTDHAASVNGLAARFAKLDPTGAPAVGATNAFVTNAFMSLAFTPEYTAGDEIEQKGADGGVCVYYKMPDVLKRVTFQLAICAPEPDLYEMLAGGDVIMEGQDAIGWSAPETGVDATPDGLSMEFWSRAIVGGRPASVNPFFRWVFPYCQMQLTGDRTLENGLMANTFSGWGVGNIDFGDGPQNDWDYTSARAYQFVRTDSYPDGINGFQPVIADA